MAAEEPEPNAPPVNQEETLVEDAGSDGGEEIAPTGKKKKKRKKKSKHATTPLLTGTRVPLVRGITGFTDSYVAVGQSDPPTIPVAKLFPQGNFPAGEIQEHPGDWNTHRITSEEMRARERDCETQELYKNIRHAAEVHRHVRKFTQQLVQPGIRLIDMCEQLDNKNRELVEEAGFARGIAFPTGCSLNHVAAHYTPNPGDNTVLQYGDVMKLDFGTQVDGRIIDCAFTMAFDPKFDPLLEAVKAATNTGIQHAGIDARLGEIGAAIQEVMESHEIELDGKVYPIKSIRNLGGHSMGKHMIHGDKHVPIVKTNDNTKMEEGEIFAIETFGTTGRGYTVEDMECSHYMKVRNAPHVPLQMPRAKKLLAHLNHTFGTLAFCRRWLERDDGGSRFLNPKGAKQDKYVVALKQLVDAGLVSALPPLVDIKGSYTAQYEHTVILRPTCKEVVSRGDDY